MTHILRFMKLTTGEITYFKIHEQGSYEFIKNINESKKMLLEEAKRLCKWYSTESTFKNYGTITCVNFIEEFENLRKQKEIELNNIVSFYKSKGI